MPPLKLEEADQGTFLETFILNKGSHIEWRLKNKNEGSRSQRFYNYQHFHSYSPKHTKIGAVIGVFKKIERFRLCSSPKHKGIALQQKLKEFQELKYPMKQVCDIARNIVKGVDVIFWFWFRITPDATHLKWWLYILKRAT